MKIGYILSLKKGLHRFIYRELCAMHELGNEITIFTTKNNTGIYNPKKEWTVKEIRKFELLVSQIIWLLKNPSKYLALLLESLSTNSIIDFLISIYYAKYAKKLDIIHAHFGDHKLFIGYYLKKLTGNQLSVTIHAHELYRNPNWKMFKKSLDSCDKIVSISDFNKKYLIEKFGIDPKKIEVIRLFVDMKADVISETKKILVVGSFEERKGYDTLLEAIKILKREDYVVWIVGEGHIDIKKIAEELGISRKIKFFGNLHADILNILFYACDIFCLPSKTAKVKKVENSNITAEGTDCEGIPVVLMEAMSYGKPVVTTKHAGIPELVKDFLIDENDPKGLAAELNKLLNEKTLRAKSGVRNRHKIIEEYSIANSKKLFNYLQK